MAAKVKNIMRMRILYVILFLIAPHVAVFSQQERKHIRQGNKNYEAGDFEASELKYRKAMDAEGQSYAAKYNLAASLFKQEKYDESAELYKSLTLMDAEKEQQAKTFYNLGNALLQQQKLKESVEAYKKSLLLNPSDLEAKYNLSYALRLMKQQQNQQQNQQQQNQGQNQPPSEYAKELKRKAEQLVAQRKYNEAYTLMVEGEKIDPSVGAFASFTQRIKDVIEIYGF